MITQAIGISRQLHGWVESLKNTEIKGVKYLTNIEKAKIEQDKEFEEFDRKMAEFRVEFERRLHTGEINRRSDAAESH